MGSYFDLYDTFVWFGRQEEVVVTFTKHQITTTYSSQQVITMRFEPLIRRMLEGRERDYHLLDIPPQWCTLPIAKW